MSRAALNQAVKVMEFVGKITIFFSTIYFRLRYFPFVFLKPNVKIGSRVTVKPFYNLMKKNDKIFEIRLGKSVRIGAGTLLQGSGVLTVGDRSFCGENCVFGANSTVTIGGGRNDCPDGHNPRYKSQYV